MKRDYSTMLSETWFRLLFRLYPRDFREEMGEAMLQTYRDRLREAMNRRDLSVARLWFAALRDSLRNGPAERLRPAASWRRSGNWGGDAERVVRRVAHTRGRVKRFRRRRTSGLLPGGETRHRNRA